MNLKLTKCLCLLFSSVLFSSEYRDDIEFIRGVAKQYRVARNKYKIEKTLLKWNKDFCPVNRDLVSVDESIINEWRKDSEKSLSLKEYDYFKRVSNSAEEKYYDLVDGFEVREDEFEFYINDNFISGVEFYSEITRNSMGLKLNKISTVPVGLTLDYNIGKNSLCLNAKYKILQDKLDYRVNYNILDDRIENKFVYKY